MENHGLRVAGLEVRMQHCNAPEMSWVTDAKSGANVRALCPTGQTDAHPMDVSLFTVNVNDVSTDLLSAQNTGAQAEHSGKPPAPLSLTLTLGDGRGTASQFCVAMTLDRTRGEDTWRASNRGHGPLQREPRSQTPSTHRTLPRTFVREPGLELASAPGAHVEPQLDSSGSLLLQHRLAPPRQRPSLADGSGPRKQMQMSQPPTG